MFETNNDNKNVMLLSEAKKLYPIPEHAKNEPIFENIPSVLRERNLFIGWKFDYRYNKDDKKYVELDPDTGIPRYPKIPLDLHKWNPSTKRFSYGASNQQETYITLEEFMSVWNDPVKRKAIHGLGIPFTEGMVGIDEDNFIDSETGEWNPEAKARADYLNSYTEYSVRGNGTHTLVLGSKPSNARSRKGKKEIYDNGRFFTFTGHLVPGYPTEIQENQEGITRYYYEVVDTAWKAAKVTGEEERGKEEIANPAPVTENEATLKAVEAVFRLVRLCHDNKFIDMYTKGHEYCLNNMYEYRGKSHSEVDAGLLLKLATFTECNKQAMKAVFKNSSLYRKTRGERYLDTSIDSAVTYCQSQMRENGGEEEVPVKTETSDIDCALRSGSYDLPIRFVKDYEVYNNGVVKVKIDKKTGAGERKQIIIGRTEIIGFSDNLDIDLNDTESNKFTHYKLRTGDITLYPEHGDFLTRVGIINLIKKGMLAQEGDIKDITGYFLGDIPRAKMECPQIKVCTRPGWKRGNSIFVSGNYAYSDKGAVDVYLTNPITGQIYKKSGTLEGWLIPELKEWLGNEGARFLFYAAFSSYIVSLLGVQNIVISMIDGTSVGKTLSASIAGSGMGRTDKKESGESIVRAANITQAAAEYLSVAINGHYVVFDDATPGKDYSGLVYMISNGRKKDRAPSSMLESGEVYNAVYVLTGEQQILKDTVTQGANGRILDVKLGIKKSPENAEKAKKIEEDIKENYGHIAEPFLKKLFDRKGTIKSKYLELCNRFRDEGKDIGGRLGDQMACICIAGEIVEEIFSEIGIDAKDPYAICDQVIQDNATSEQKREYWIRGLEIVYGEIEAWDKEIGSDGKPTQNLKIGKGLGGNFTGEWLNVIETNIKDICEKNHLDKKDLIKKWSENGVTRTDAPTKDKHGIEVPKYNKTVKIDGFSKKTISFNIRKVQKVLGYEDDSKEGATLTGVPKIDIAIFKKHVKDISEAWSYLYNRPPEEGEVSEFCNLYYGKFPGDSDYYTVDQIMGEAAGNFETVQNNWA